jgi:hypothetical protein
MTQGNREAVRIHGATIDEEMDAGSSPNSQYRKIGRSVQQIIVFPVVWRRCSGNTQNNRNQ